MDSALVIGIISLALIVDILWLHLVYTGISLMLYINIPWIYVVPGLVVIGLLCNSLDKNRNNKRSLLV